MSEDAALTRDPGVTSVVNEQRAVASTDNVIVSNAILRILQAGGNAVDAAIAGCIVQATVEPFMTNHAGTVTFLYYDAASERLYALDGRGALPHDLPPFKPVPALASGYSRADMQPSAAIPGFMPSLKMIYDRFGSTPWHALVEEAIYWAEEGHPVSSFEHMLNAFAFDFITYFPESRALYMQDGFLPVVGSRFRNPELAKTLKALAKEGPDYFITGLWAQHFIEKANALGWPITQEHMTATPPRWGDPVRYQHKGYEIAHLPLPQRQGIFCALTLGILEGIPGGDAPVDSSDAVWAMAHALRLASQLCGFINDPAFFAVPVETLLDPSLHARLAALVAKSKPKVDLTKHIENTSGKAKMAAAGLPLGKAAPEKQPSGSCELAVVDAHGNWVQMMNTLQSGGIPGQVVDGVPMVGSHATTGNMGSSIDAWLAPGVRMRSALGNSIALRAGRPVFSLGTPGNVFCTVPQVLANLIDRKMDFLSAVEAPRMLPLGEDYSLTIESRLSKATLQELTARGIRLQSEVEYDFHMGSFQMAWREKSGKLGACADRRRCGVAVGVA